jgi:hypothetical protein
VFHSPSERVRANWLLNSTGRVRSTTQEGFATPMKSWLLANEAQDSTLQLPMSPTSAASVT